MTGELAPQPAAGEMGQLALLADVCLPQIGRVDPLEPVPEPATGGPCVEVVEVRPEVVE